MTRMDLHSKVGTLAEELDFLNHLYELVSWQWTETITFTYGIGDSPAGLI